MTNTPTASKPRTLVNILGIPGILTVTWLGGWWYFIFIWVVVLLGSVELKKLVQHQNGTPLMILLFLSVSAVVVSYLLYVFAPSVFGYVDFGILNGIFNPIDIVILGIIIHFH